VESGEFFPRRLGRSLRVQGVQKFKSSYFGEASNDRQAVQEFNGSRVQRFKSSTVQEFNGSRVQWFKSSRVQWFKAVDRHGMPGNGQEE